MAALRSDEPPRVRILIVGDQGVGKTTLLRTLQGLPGRAIEPSTVGAGLEAVLFHVGDQVLTVEFVDVGGHDAYAASRNVYFSDYDGALLVFDVEQRHALPPLIERWMDELVEAHTARGEAPPNVPVGLVCTKLDLVDRNAEAVYLSLSQIVPSFPSLARDVPVIPSGLPGHDPTAAFRAFLEVVWMDVQANRRVRVDEHNNHMSPPSWNPA